MSYLRSQWRGRLSWGAGATALLATAATLASTIATTAAPASADGNSPPSGPAVTVPVLFSSNRLDQIKAEAAKLIANRLGSLQWEINLVDRKSFLGTDGAALVNEMQADVAGLQALGAEIAGATTVPEALSDSDLIFTQFRVYLLMLPVSGDVTSVDYITNAQLPYIVSVLNFLQGNENSSNLGVIGP